jgi:hypothetical protein
LIDLNTVYSKEVLFMKIGAASYAFGGIASYLGLGPTLPEKLKAIKVLGFDRKPFWTVGPGQL